MSLPKVVEIDSAKCVNCHRCISVCPVKFCNQGIGDHVSLNHDLCIGCGECLKACEHEARIAIDDFDAAFFALRQKEKMVAIVAPGIAANFPNQYLNFNGYLKSAGVSAIFDVSFGAELTVKTYLEHIKSKSPRMVIAQSCPVIVTYLEIYQPELLPYLAPGDSPMAHTMKMIRHFYPQYEKHKIMIISPCIAKKREFDEIGLGDYNVTIKKISQHLQKNQIDLSLYNSLDYDNDPAERAVLFSTPGGLLKTALREVPEIESKTRKIEGPHLIYNYFKKLPQELERKVNPLLVDCLNCEKGCNGGTGTESQYESIDYFESLIENRQKNAVAYYQKDDSPQSRETSLAEIRKTVDRYWKPGLYQRSYQNRSAMFQLKIPSSFELSEIYQKMLKNEPQDFKNCNNCGYNSCEKMGIAIFNGLNRIENCHLYLQKIVEQDTSTLKSISENMNQSIGTLHQNEIAQSNQMIQKMIGLMDQIVKIAEMSHSLVKRLGESNSQIKSHLQDIFKIAKQINLLSINASIESSKAGVYGRGFNVVAGEIKTLSAHTNNFTKEIDQLAMLIKTNTQDIEKAIHEEKQQVGEGKQTAEELGFLLRNISERIAELKSYSSAS